MVRMLSSPLDLLHSTCLAMYFGDVVSAGRNVCASVPVARNMFRRMLVCTLNFFGLLKPRVPGSFAGIFHDQDMIRDGGLAGAKRCVVAFLKVVAAWF